jgi:OOP family OmpA-OmpF porin
MKASIAIGIAALGLAAAAPALAQSQSNWNPMSRNYSGYVGVSGGESKFRTDCASLFDCDTKDTGWKVYAGGKANEIFGMEAGYTDFGRVRASGGETDAWAANLSLVAGVPIGDRFSVFAKGGGIYGRTDVKASASSLVKTGHKNGWGTTWGVGAALGLTQAVQVRLDWDRYKLDFIGGSRDVDMLSAGVQMRF